MREEIRKRGRSCEIRELKDLLELPNLPREMLISQRDARCHRRRPHRRRGTQTTTALDGWHDHEGGQG